MTPSRPQPRAAAVAPAWRELWALAVAMRPDWDPYAWQGAVISCRDAGVPFGDAAAAVWRLAWTSDADPAELANLARDSGRRQARAGPALTAEERAELRAVALAACEEATERFAARRRGAGGEPLPPLAAAPRRGAGTDRKEPDGLRRRPDPRRGHPRDVAVVPRRHGSRYRRAATRRRGHLRRLAGRMVVREPGRAADGAPGAAARRDRRGRPRGRLRATRAELRVRRLRQQRPPVALVVAVRFPGPAAGPGNGRASSKRAEVTCLDCLRAECDRLHQAVIDADALRGLVWDMLDAMPASTQALGYAVRAGQLGVTDEQGRPLVMACAQPDSARDALDAQTLHDSPGADMVTAPEMAAPVPGRASEPWPCCHHCIDGDGMLPCGEIHDDPCGDCGWSDAEIREWRKGLDL